MASSILAFRAPQARKIPTPVHYQPGDVYDLVEVTDDSFLSAGFPSGCLLYVKVGRLYRQLPHFAIWRDRPRLGYVTDYGHLALDWLSFDAERVGGMPSGIYPLAESGIVGAITEIRSFGWDSPVWVYNEGRAVSQLDEFLGRLISKNAN